MRISTELSTYADAKGLRQIKLVFFSGTRVRWGTSLHVHPKQWDKRRQCVRMDTPNGMAMNAAIGDVIRRVERIVVEEPQITPAELRDRLSRPDMRGQTFLEITLADLKEFPPKSWHTAQLREGNARRFDVFAPDIRTRAITPLVAQKYHAHILARGVTRNTASTQMHVLRTLYNRACKIEGIEPKRILADVDHVERYNTVPEFLVPAEVELLKGYASKVTGWAQKAVHMWLFSLYAGGMRWTDLCLLTWGNVKGGRVTYTANKTGKAKNVELHPEAVKALNGVSCTKHARNGEKRSLSGHLLTAEPIFGVSSAPRSIAAANVIANRELKIAATSCGINKRIHTHNARHSFAAWALAAGMDDRAIQQILGVDDKAFRHYRARFSTEVLDEGMRKVLG